MADISKIKPNGADGTEYDIKDATARSAIADKANNTQTFTEASTRANIASGENMSTLFGKIKKFFSDLKTVAFTGAYSDLSGQPTIPAAVAVKGNAESAYRTGNVNITPANIGLGNVNNTADANKSVNYATSAGSAAKGTNNKFETTFLTLGSNGNEPTVTVYDSVSGDGTLKVGFNPNDTAMGSSGRNLYLPIGSMYSSGQATLATVEYLNSNFTPLVTSSMTRTIIKDHAAGSAQNDVTISSNGWYTILGIGSSGSGAVVNLLLNNTEYELVYAPNGLRQLATIALQKGVILRQKGDRSIIARIS